MLKEVTLGHTAGPFHIPPFSNLQVYPIGVIPKKHSSEWRTIFHLSYPKHRPTSVNAHIPPESYSLQYIKVDHAIAILYGEIKSSYSHITAAMEKLLYS